MYLRTLRALNFRNFDDLDLSFHPDKNHNIILAPNGMGKSNLLEAVYYLAHARPFRQAKDQDIIRKGSNHFFLQAEFSEAGHPDVLKIKYQKKKELEYNLKKVIKHSEILGKLLTVLFSNDDLFIVSGSPAVRRHYFDIFFSVLDQEYLYYLKKYQNLLKQKNTLLKSDQPSLLFTYDIQLAETIFYIQQKRNLLIQQISLIFQENFLKISQFGEKVKIIYKPACDMKELTKENILIKLEQSRKRDIEAGHSQVGSHRDQYLFLISGKVFHKFASFGQTRLASLVLKLAQSQMYQQKFHKKPIFLIDDVILELDPVKQQRFLSEISAGYQLFFTITDDKYLSFFPDKNKIHIIRMKDGKIINESA
ncbi:MAG: DNA replication and repair protein RecF [Spirochaetes bacterium]|nr:DNA replication and repair protein RecF [Spirochaetota bacterium]